MDDEMQDVEPEDKAALDAAKSKLDTILERQSGEEAALSKSLRVEESAVIDGLLNTLASSEKEIQVRSAMLYVAISCCACFT
jgi:hypothetical protein